MENITADRQFMSRRKFLKGAAALTATAGVAALTGCAGKDAAGSDVKWDREADIIAVGAGGAGLSCAIEATDLGMSVIVLESQPSVGGSSTLCNGGISMPGTPLQKEQGIEDSVELFAEDLIKNTGPYNNPDWLKLHAEKASGLWEWLTGMGLEFKKESLLATQGQSAAREHHIVPSTVIKALQDRAKKQGGEVLTNTTAYELVRDPASKRVVGVKAKDANGKDIALKANGGVVLCTNGYSRNADMLNQYIFGSGGENVYCYAGMGDLGQGHLMAMALGADTRNMARISLLTGQNPDGDAGAACSLFHGGAVLVNQEGRRFVNESKGYGNVWIEVSTQTGGYCWQIWDEDIAVEYAKNDSSLYSMEKVRATKLLLQANTLEELASLTKIPVDALVATMQKYNADISATGGDTAFGRKTKVSMVGTPPLIDKAPFYAFKTGNVLYGTTGGIKHNLDMQVVDVMGEVIEGLYLAGTIATYSNMGLVPGTIRSVGASGCGFGGALCWGRFAAQQIKNLELKSE